MQAYQPNLTLHLSDEGLKCLTESVLATLFFAVHGARFAPLAVLATANQTPFRISPI